ncbi:exonuclease SbcD [Catenibacillus scindens]|uniref:Nuclease SbcCD subunit D n=1 Tax=Catenibacillus scindens TaxID=673271 RepID=A0A7W8HBG0_9FIRM|nr:exonuclease SbcCD subunit D [Catenibacillus scindens]MBB5265307.1 exonuclease SbcD [Catenibacillus scindens]
MKFFHLSDLHIGLRLMNRDLLEDQTYILEQITALAGEIQPDAVVIAGDIYDKAVPSGEAVALFDRFIEGLVDAIPKGEIMIISGNHDSGSRLNCFRGVLSKQRVHMIGLAPQIPGDFIEKVTLEDTYGKVNFYLLPFVRPSMVKGITEAGGQEGALSYNETVKFLINRENINEEERNVIVSHQFYLPSGKTAEDVERMDSEVRTVGNIDQVDAAVLAPFDYGALGHIHKPMKVGSDYFRYCGTPLACSVSEAGQEKGVVEVDMGPKGEIKVSVIPLKPLRQVRVIQGTLEEVLQASCDDYVTVLLTDPVDLDVLDMQDRLRQAFPHLLEIRRKTWRQADYQAVYEPAAALDPFELCCSFLKDMTDEEKDILKDVINRIQEVEGL